MAGEVNDNQQTNKGQPAATNLDNARDQVFAPPANNSRSRLEAQLGLAPGSAQDAPNQAPAAGQESPRAGVRTDTQKAWWQQTQAAPDTRYIPGPAIKADNPLPGQFRERWNTKTPGALGEGATAADYKKMWGQRSGRTEQAAERDAKAQTAQNKAEDAATIERYQQLQRQQAQPGERPQGLPKPAQPVDQQQPAVDQTRSVLVGQPTLAPAPEVGQPTLAPTPVEQQLPNIAPLKAVDNTAPLQVQQTQRPLASFNDMVSLLDGQPLTQSGTVQQAEIATVNALLSTTRGVSSTQESQTSLELTLFKNGWTEANKFTAESYAKCTPDQFQQGDVIVTHLPGGQAGNSAVYIGNGHIFHYDATSKSMKVDSLAVLDKFEDMSLYRKAQTQAAVQVQAADTQTQALVPIPDAGIQGTQTTVTTDTNVVQQQQQQQQQPAPVWVERQRVELPPIKGIPADPEARLRQLLEQPPIQGTDVRVEQLRQIMGTMEGKSIDMFVQGAKPNAGSVRTAAFIVENAYGFPCQAKNIYELQDALLSRGWRNSSLDKNQPIAPANAKASWDNTMAFPAGRAECKAYFDRAMPGDIFILGHTNDSLDPQTGQVIKGTKHLYSSQGHAAIYIGRTPEGDHVIFHNNNETGKMCYESVNVLLTKTIDGDKQGLGGYTAGWVFRKTGNPQQRDVVPAQAPVETRPANKPCCTPSAPEAPRYYQQQPVPQPGYRSSSYVPQQSGLTFNVAGQQVTVGAQDGRQYVAPRSYNNSQYDNRYDSRNYRPQSNVKIPGTNIGVSPQTINGVARKLFN